LVGLDTRSEGDRFLPSGDESGTAPEDRRFRPDIQGLRAVAIILVVLWHAGIPGIHGGYVGVDVFFVISGFVITGVLLREREGRGHTSLLAFYGRRARRIIPAASLVIVVTVVGAYAFLGSSTGRNTAVDGQWASVFLANLHFAVSSTNYLASLLPPSPLQNFWSLAVEEQFYLVYPALFLLLGSLAIRLPLRVRIGVLLGIGGAASYALSIALTASNPSNAYFSPLTRAWELALGGLVALASHQFRRLPTALAAVASWLGLLCIVWSAVSYTSSTAYPGSLVGVPVIGSALVIAGGTAEPQWGVESVLRLRPFQWIGLVSYSWYLWHWPILTIATQATGRARLPTWENIALVLGALVLAIGTYLVVENPIRHSVALVSRRWASVAMGTCLIVSTLIVSSFAIEETQASDVGNITVAASGSNCNLPSATKLASLAQAYQKTMHNSGKSAKTDRIKMMVAGDSTACSMLPGLSVVGAPDAVHIDDAAVIGCGIVSGVIAPYYSQNVNLNAYTVHCQSDAERAEQSILDRRPDIIVWLSTHESSSIVVATRGGTKVLKTGTASWRAEMLRRMNQRVERFIATGAKVVLVQEPPTVDPSHPNRPTARDEAFEDMNDLLREVAALHPSRVGVVDLGERVCPSGPPCRGLVGGRDLRPDDYHY